MYLNQFFAELGGKNALSFFRWSLEILVIVYRLQCSCWDISIKIKLRYLNPQFERKIQTVERFSVLSSKLKCGTNSIYLITIWGNLLINNVNHQVHGNRELCWFILPRTIKPTTHKVVSRNCQDWQNTVISLPCLEVNHF